MVMIFRATLFGLGLGFFGLGVDGTHVCPDGDDFLGLPIFGFDPDGIQVERVLNYMASIWRVWVWASGDGVILFLWLAFFGFGLHGTHVQMVM